MSLDKVDNVTDIINIDYLQRIQDGLGNIIGITTVLLDPKGIPVSQPTNLKAFCELMYMSETGSAMCAKANANLMAKNEETRGPAIITCPNSGLRTAAVPIFLKDRFLGSWLIGQIRMNDIDNELIEQTAQKAGLSQETAKESFNILPVVTEQEFDNILEFLETVTKALTDMVEMNATLDKRNSELESLMGSLDNTLQNFRDFINLTDLGAYLVDFETGELIMSNDVYRDLIASDGVVQGKKDASDDSAINKFFPFEPKKVLVDERGKPREPYTWEWMDKKTKQWFSMTSRVIDWVDGRRAIMTTFLDITARKSEEERVAYLAYNDQRLNIPNGVKLYEDLNELHDSAFLICFDIQGLSRINDAYSRDAGDCLLKSIVRWFKEYAPDDLTLYCTEGDDFVVLAPGYTLEQVMSRATDIYNRFESAWAIDINGMTQNMYTGAHMGVLKLTQSFESTSVLLSTVQRVLSFARDEGVLVYFDKKKNADLAKRIQLEVELKSCILDNMNGFTLNYQPLVDARSGGWKGVEALCRWSGPTLGMIPPDIFIEVAEQLGLISILTDWVIEEAVSQAKAWKLDTFEDFVLDINLSPVQLSDRELVPRVVGMLEKYDYPPEKLSLEITETAEVRFDEPTLKALEEIGAAGISLALDDFGTGYASFSNLNKLPVDTLKTDRSFVMGLEDDPFLQQTVKSMITLADAAGLTTVAEGVETESQRKFMEENGIDLIQGYFYSRPLSKEDFEASLDRFGS